VVSQKNVLLKLEAVRDLQETFEIVRQTVRADLSVQLLDFIVCATLVVFKCNVTNRVVGLQLLNYGLR